MEVQTTLEERFGQCPYAPGDKNAESKNCTTAREKAHDRYDDYGTGFSYWYPVSLDRVVKGGKVFPFPTGISSLHCL